jgi:hypothetical protein
MNLDIALTMASVVWSVLTVYLGVEMTIRPPTSPRRKWIYRILSVLLGLLLATTAFFQSSKNASDQQKLKDEAAAQQKRQDLQFGEVKGKLDTIATIASNLPANLTPVQVSSLFQTVLKTTVSRNPDVLSNMQLRDEAVALVEQMRKSESDKAEQLKELMDYWKYGVPDTETRHRTQEFDSLQSNQYYDFQSHMLAKYAYLTQELVNRVSERRLAPLGMSKGNVSGWLSAGGLYANPVNMMLLADRLEQLAKLLP